MGLNAILAGRWLPLESTWNHMVSSGGLYREFSELIHLNAFDEFDDTGVVHFLTAHKPWQADYDHPAKDLFFHYLDQTPWTGWRP